MVNSKLILCVDDDPDDQDLLSMVITSYFPDLKMIRAENGLEAINFLTSAKEKKDLPFLVVLDINMPIMNGKETLQNISIDSELKEIKVVVFSNSINPNDQVFFGSKRVEMLTKPSLFTEFAETVKRFLVN